MSKKSKKSQKPEQDMDINPANYVGGVHRFYVEAAERYAAADPSDPFARARAMTHLKNGIASYGPKGENNFYGADQGTETRYLKRADGTLEEYQAVVFTNRQRP